MLPEKYRWIVVQFEPEGNPRLLFRIGCELADEGNLEGAATVFDRAYGLDPTDAEIQQRRQSVLDRLAVNEHGIHFRYIPAGPFLMGTEHREPDERPWHPVWLRSYWMSETPVSWATYCRLLAWEPPPLGRPREEPQSTGGRAGPVLFLHEANKIRLQYCEDETTRARDWHSHFPNQLWLQGGQPRTAQELFGSPPRRDPNAPWTYEAKPMVAVGWQEAEELASALSTPQIRYGLPTEAQWEKAARGGLIGQRHAWGDEPPTAERCDFSRFHELSILPMRTFAPNGYGLYAVNGCVWEWTRDWYDRDAYHHLPDTDPEGPATGEEKVLRGGSWTDCPEVVTVTFRASRPSGHWRNENWGGHLSPNIGFRLCRTLN